jgi:hypothetical protein
MNLQRLSKSWYEEHYKLLRLLGYSPALWFLIFLNFSTFVGQFIRGPFLQARLTEELGKIVPPPQTQTVKHTEWNNNISVSLIEEYSTALKLDELCHYYDARLTENGWWFLEREAYSTTEIRYCKGNYTAALNFPGVYGKDLERAQNRWEEKSPGIPFPDYKVIEYQGVYSLSLESGSWCATMKGGGLRVLSFKDCVCLLLASLCWIVSAVLIFRATQVMGDDELVQLWRDLHLKLQTGIWGTRVLSAIWLILGITSTLISAYKIAMYLTNWAPDALAL